MLQATVYFLKANEGGRKISLIPLAERNYSVWFNTKDKNKNHWSIGLFFEPQTVVIPGSTHTIHIDFFAKKAYDNFERGDELNICEGPKVIARGKIL